MTKEDLIELKEKIANLTDDEKNQRDLYLKQLADGKIYGPLTGYSSIDKPWLQFYDEKIFNSGVPNMSAYEFMTNSNIGNSDGIALYYLGKKYTYTDLNKKILEVESSLRANGVKKGDIVSIAIPNTPENVFLFYALNKIGAVANMVDLRMKGEMLKDSLNEVNSKLMIGCDLFLENIAEIVDKTQLEKVVVTSPADSLPPIVKQLYKLSSKTQKVENNKFEYWNDFINTKGNNSYEIEEVDENTPACILHTSGTTGKAKGVILTNKAFNNMAVQYQNLGIDYVKGEKFMNQVPPFLAYNLVVSTHMPLCMGLDIVMLPNYEPDKFAEHVMKYKINHVLAGPADWSNFLNNPKVKKADFSYLHTMGSGSDKLNSEKKSEVNELIKNHGGEYTILEGYGMTEVSSAACSEMYNVSAENGVGVPLPKMSISIFDDETNKELQYNQLGEICITGPTMMAGYYNNEIETNKTIRIHEDGTPWIHTGDIGYMDEKGILYLSGRKKRIIIRHDGIKISPYDIEKVVDAIDFIDSCCVVGVNDIVHGSGSVPCINVVPNPSSNLTKEEIENIIIEKCNLELTEKYCIKEINVMDKFPLTPVGKVDYRKLTDICNEKINANINTHEERHK